MKKLIFFSLLSLALFSMGCATSTSSADKNKHKGHEHVLMLNPTDIEWSDVASMAEPAKISILEGDPSKAEPFTFRLLLPAGYKVLPHTHPAYERVTVIQGVFHFAHGKEFDREKTTTLPVGGYSVMPPGVPMFGYTEEDTVIQIHGTGPWGIDYINPEDDPRL